MGFSKANYRGEFQVVVTLPMNPGDAYTFTFPKRLPQAALDAEKSFLGLGEEATADDWRRALIKLVAEMMTRPPEGFDDFPVKPGDATDPAALREAAVSYFDDTGKPELETIVIKAWKEYKAAAIPAAYTKSFQADSPAGGNTSRASAEAAPGL